MPILKAIGAAAEGSGLARETREEGGIPVSLAIDYRVEVYNLWSRVPAIFSRLETRTRDANLILYVPIRVSVFNSAINSQLIN